MERALYSEISCMHFINMSVFVHLKTEFSKRTSFAIAKKINEVSERKKILNKECAISTYMNKTL